MKPARATLPVLVGLLMMVTANADQSDGPERPLSPFMCERWQTHVETLQQSDDRLEQQLGEFHAQQDMQFCQVQTVRVTEEPESEWEFGLPQMGALAWIMRALAIAVLIGLVIWLAWRWNQRFERARQHKDQRQPPPGPQTRAARAYSSLPDDIPAAAMEAWQAGHPRQAMSLLYRGAVVRLLPEKRINQARTEREIIAALDQAAISHDTLAWMKSLVNAWLGTAWADRPPREEEFFDLHQQWSRHCPARPEGAQ